MRIVIDANVLIAALFSEGKTLELLFNERLEPVAPALLFDEVQRNLDRVSEKTGLSKDDCNKAFLALRGRIKEVSPAEFSHALKEANNSLAGHIKDTEYVALAIALHIPLWSKEKLLKRLPGIEVLDAAEVEARLFRNP
ncbi:MAG: PIN domain-containing protein [Nanoarchaeota archaeon]